MLLEFVFSNHRSFRGESFFSMVAAPGNAHSEMLVDFADHKILRTALLFGANGSGKSNVIDALLFVRDLVCNSAHNLPGVLGSVDNSMRFFSHCCMPVSRFSGAYSWLFSTV